MNISAIQVMLQTRMKAADGAGNHTEKSFLYELWKLSEEMKNMKERCNNEESNNSDEDAKEIKQ